MSPLNLRHNPPEHRFEMEVDGHLSVVEYAPRDHTVVFTHTFVPPELRGRGIAEKLVRAALAHAGEAGWRIVPACSYVAAYIGRHPEFKPLLAE